MRTSRKPVDISLPAAAVTHLYFELPRANRTCLKWFRCLQESDDAARQPGTGVAGGQAVREPSSAQVVDVRVHDHRASQDAVRADQRDVRVLEREHGHARVVPVDVAQVTGMPVLVLRSAVFFLSEMKQKKPLVNYRNIPHTHTQDDFRP